ncbi:hypothetical protein FHS23_002175 [Prauserella isguenensis]|uniref:Uncharacterized protein n=1 Tax=Prauserella isguenensis TaxID=1470180 RepID=A0A839S188_9PSEU|nr:hypothetical protein [Prauserella isguenensis]
MNKLAVQRYAQFVSAMDLVAEQFDELDKLIARVGKGTTESGFTVPTQGELKGLRAKAFGELDQMRMTAKKFEAELMSRPWKV